MNKYKARLMTSHNTANHTRFSKEVLEDLEREQRLFPVTVNFTPPVIGVVEKLEMDGDALVCTFKINDPNAERWIEEFFLVPQGIVRPEDVEEDESGVKIIKKMELMSASICFAAADPNLTKITKGE
jgi:hypothetical protein